MNMQNISSEEKELESGDVSRYFASLEANGGCPICGNLHWQLAPSGEGRHFTIPRIDNKGAVMSGDTYLPVVALVCSKCWFVRTHAALPIVKWLKENPSSPNK